MIYDLLQLNYDLMIHAVPVITSGANRKAMLSGAGGRTPGGGGGGGGGGGNGVGQGASTPTKNTAIDYTRYVKRFSSAMECGSPYCKDLNYRLFPIHLISLKFIQLT